MGSGSASDLVVSITNFVFWFSVTYVAVVGGAIILLGLILLLALLIRKARGVEDDNGRR